VTTLPAHAMGCRVGTDNLLAPRLQRATLRWGQHTGAGADCFGRGGSRTAPTTFFTGFSFASLVPDAPIAETRHYEFRKPRFAVIVCRHSRPPSGLPCRQGRYAGATLRVEATALPEKPPQTRRTRS